MVSYSIKQLFQISTHMKISTSLLSFYYFIGIHCLTCTFCLYNKSEEIFKMTTKLKLNQNQHISCHRKTTVIAHRGNCSIFPQNTRQAIIAGIHVADLTEFDVHLTKDEQVIVFHDRYLSRTTDIKDHPQFSHRLKEDTIDDYQERRADWWVRDFTLQELKNLNVCQPVKYRPQFDFMRFEISTLEEIIEESLSITSKQIHKNILKSGLLIEIKEEIAAELTNKDKILCKKIVDILKHYNLHTLEGCRQNNLMVVIQSFNIPLLSCLQGCQNWIFQLYDKDEVITEEFLISKRTKNVKGIGVTQKNLQDKEGRHEKRVGQLCKKLDYSLCYWTIRDDDMNSKPFGCKTYQQVYLTLAQLGVTGFITEFPDKCKGVLQIESTMYSKGNLETDVVEIEKGRKISECESADSLSHESKQI